ncbi:hypothetical protein LIER_22918 [Lithospermum erythrorhizon]|uniref:Uncharacterized protein n=1 Tax=Lithospermum erythrorhizon TaxID=34254 RepID=A0AAV3R1A2_LITER
MAKKGQGKRLAHDHRCQTPEPRRRSALDSIREPEREYSRTDLQRGSVFSRLLGDPWKRKEVKEGKIENLTLLKTSTENVFLEIEDRRLLPRPPQQKASQTKRDMSKFFQYHKC